MNAFTAGPWRCEIDDDTQEPRIYAPQRENKLREQLICTVGYCREELETSEPTARLIAAAPELYEALRECVAWMDLREKVGAGERITDRARAALLKATPEQSDV